MRSFDYRHPLVQMISQVGRAQDVPDMHRAELGNCWATLCLCPIYRESQLSTRAQSDRLVLDNGLAANCPTTLIGLVVCSSEVNHAIFLLDGDLFNDRP